MFSHGLGVNRLLAGVLLLSLLAMLLWSPWLTRAYAEQRAVDGFTARWQAVMDGCGLNCTGCGVREIQRVLFGYQVRLEYACGIRSMGAPDGHQSVWVLVSMLGTVHGMPEP